MAKPPVTKQAVANWRSRYDDFPKPVQTLQSGPVWEAEVVESWLAAKTGHSPVVISFINQKGGTGKTTTSIAVAEILAKEFQKHVLFIDLDPQTNATVNLIKEEEWRKRDQDGRTLAQLFKAKLSTETKFDIEETIIRGVSTIDDGIPRLELLPSSMQLIEVQERLPYVALQGNYETNPQDILRRALQPVIERYDFVIIDCPPSLGLVTKNGLRFSTHYVIPVIPDILSTWGIFQIVSRIAAFCDDINWQIKPLGIVATKVQANMELHSRIMRQLEEGRFFNEKHTDLKQPPLFKHYIKQNVHTARGADSNAPIRTFQQKYNLNYDNFYGLTTEILDACK